jgi:hypothetical protein
LARGALRVPNQTGPRDQSSGIPSIDALSPRPRGPILMPSDLSCLTRQVKRPEFTQASGWHGLRCRLGCHESGSVAHPRMCSSFVMRVAKASRKRRQPSFRRSTFRLHGFCHLVLDAGS